MFQLMHCMLQHFTRPLEKHKEAIKNFILSDSLNKGANVLDFGCGEGLFSRLFDDSRTIRYFGIDNNPGCLKLAKELNRKSNFAISNEALCFKDEVFDYFILNNVLHHMSAEERIRLVSEIGRVLKKDSFILIIEIVSRGGQRGIFIKLVTYIEEKFKKIKYCEEGFLEEYFNKRYINYGKNKLDDNYFLYIYKT